MDRDSFIAVHDQLIAEFLEKHPEVSEEQAYELTASKVEEILVDQYSDMIDRLYDQHKERAYEDYEDHDNKDKIEESQYRQILSRMKQLSGLGK